MPLGPGGPTSISAPPTALSSTHGALGSQRGPPSTVPGQLLLLCLVLSVHLHHQPADSGQPLASEVLAHRGPAPGEVRERLLNGSKWGKGSGIVQPDAVQGARCQAVNKEAAERHQGWQAECGHCYGWAWWGSV